MKYHCKPRIMTNIFEKQHHQSAGAMWRKWITHMLLVGMKNDTTSMENSLVKFLAN